MKKFYYNISLLYMYIKTHNNTINTQSLIRNSQGELKKKKNVRT